MIISRAPFRISLMGGGSDLPAYYERFSGKTLSFTINKFVYVATNPSFHKRYRFVYSRVEEVTSLDQVEHPLIREIARDYPVPFIDFASFADVPAGTGLGSSSAFTAATALNLASYNEVTIGAEDLADYSCRIEIERLGEPIGKQDQYAVCLGGYNTLHFNPDGTVSAKRHSGVRVGRFLEKHLSLVFTGITRRANSTLEEQNRNLRDDQAVVDNQREIVSMVDAMLEAVTMRDPKECGRLLHHNWELKKRLSSNVGEDSIDELYSKLLSMGAYGGKVLGAGNGGFVAVFHDENFKERLKEVGLPTLEYRFWPDGAEVVENDAVLLPR
ncbi:D-glycero-alpha-D-manno-heptose-7-phosphate kinase [Breoghania corrubedonensis]|uniref:D-glycero-alpha-D-manno-heptose-7-phosphate kinase n=1 Tax=Breoghania corrubedonensis TaxID=665038 RepID=A0A2T5UW42_9HYPH|nr:GHMP kinase [Breoghania corrubedonensis]PTW55726.1 D-glycero-alpha-D-manno-heptose-7-phosphate kinase [Breoghania corrubedonensis]